jgi:hypothetical protein
MHRITSRPYSDHSKGGWITSKGTIRAAGDPATLIVDGCISGCTPTFFLLEPLTPSHNCSTKRRGFDLNSFGGELVEGKKMLFQTLKFKFQWLVIE